MFLRHHIRPLGCGYNIKGKAGDWQAFYENKKTLYETDNVIWKPSKIPAYKTVREETFEYQAPVMPSLKKRGERGT